MLKSPVILLVSALAILAGVLVSFSGYVDDGTYVCLRYASNLIDGHGLTLNPGERVEGITNLGWTLFAALLLFLGLPAVAILQAAGVLSALALVALVWWEAGGRRRREDPRAAWCAGAAALALACSSSLAVHASGGLETAPFALLVLLGACALARGRCVLAMGLLGVATWIRPEGALAAALACVAHGCVVAGRGGPGRREAAGLALYGAIAGSLLVFRMAYYGAWVPNTYFVKGMGTWWSHRLGLLALDGMLAFQGFRWLLLLALVGLAAAAAREDEAPPHHLTELGFGALWVLAFVYYFVRIGGDEPWYRLALPVLPFVALWAARGLAAAVRWSQPAGALAALIVAAGCADALELTSRSGALRHVHARLWNCQARAGRWLAEESTRRGRPVTAAVDRAGMIAFVAPGVRFLDVVGQSDRRIAWSLYSHGFLRGTAWLIRAKGGDLVETQAAVNEIRAYLDGRRPEYVVFPVRWHGHPRPEPFEAALARRDGEFFAPWIGRNLVYHRFGADDEFHRDHELVRTFEYARGQHLLVFARRDVRAAVR